MNERVMVASFLVQNVECQRIRIVRLSPIGNRWIERYPPGVQNGAHHPFVSHTADAVLKFFLCKKLFGFVSYLDELNFMRSVPGSEQP